MAKEDEEKDKGQNGGDKNDTNGNPKLPPVGTGGNGPTKKD